MNNIEEATEVLRQGGIVIYPTDTAFGIGCRIDNLNSIKRLFKLRKRPFSQATPVLVDSIKMAASYLLSPVSDNVRLLMKDYWPGALTIVSHCRKDKVPSLVRGGGETIGVRQPNHEVVLKLISGVNVPILGPSANFHGLSTAYSFMQLDKDLIKLVDYVLEGNCQAGTVSTVIDCSRDVWKIIRQGAVTVDMSIYTSSKTILYINTSNHKKIVIELFYNEQKERMEQSVESFSSQLLLPAIVQFLEKCNINIHDVSGILVDTGPGSYTGIRVAVAVAQALAWILHIPLNGKMIYSMDITYN